MFLSYASLVYHILPSSLLSYPFPNHFLSHHPLTSCTIPTHLFTLGFQRFLRKQDSTSQKKAWQFFEIWDVMCRASQGQLQGTYNYTYTFMRPGPYNDTSRKHYTIELAQNTLQHFYTVIGKYTSLCVFIITYNYTLYVYTYRINFIRLPLVSCL